MAQTSDIDDSFAGRLTLALKALNFSRGQLSSAVGVDKSLVSRWLSGQVVPTSHNLARISDALAKLKPGFNMTLWDRPLPEFQAFLGLAPPASTGNDTAPAENGPVVAEPVHQAVDAKWIAAGLVTALVVIGVVFVTVMGRPDAITLPATGAVEPAPANSIAVLPFVNMSGDTANDYFSDGMSEEILNELANTPNLRVVGRTSSFAFKGTRAGIAEIGRRLHVRAVLEGSVREDGNRVRITAQLVNAADGFHIWSQTYDRDLGDVLKVQSEIARAIAGALTQKIAATDANVPKVNPAAYRKFLLGKLYFERRDEANTWKAIGLLREAVDLQPDFAEAYAMLAYAYLGAMNDVEREDEDITRARAGLDDALKRTLALDPNSMTALYVSMHRALLSEDWDAGVRYADRLNGINPDHMLSVRARAFLDAVFAYDREAVVEMEKATRLDPLSYTAWANLTAEYYTVGRHQDSIDAGQTALALEPNRAQELFYMCVADLALKRYDDARRLAAQLESTVEGQPLVGCRIRLDVHDGRIAEAHSLASRAAALALKEGTPSLFVADAYMYAGDTHGAIEWLDRMYRRSDPFLYELTNDQNVPAAFRQSAEWKAFQQRPRFVAWGAARQKYGAELAHREAAAP